MNSTDTPQNSPDSAAKAGAVERPQPPEEMAGSGVAPKRRRWRSAETLRKWHRAARLRAKERRKAWFTGRSCSKCGSREDLVLDHIQRLNWSKRGRSRPSQVLWEWGEPRRQDELAKCQVLCKKCHSKKTGQEHRDARVPRHGTDGEYRKHGCRCRPCKDAHTAANRRYTARLKARRLHHTPQP